MTLHEWAIRHRIPLVALQELQALCLAVYDDNLPPPDTRATTEAGVQSLIRAEASRKGMRLFRNNVGALLDERGVPVRYGLANDSEKLNKVIKSADLIGIQPVRAGDYPPDTMIGQFLSVEVKEPGWHYSGAGREGPQTAWANLVIQLGGRALFAERSGLL